MIKTDLAYQVTKDQARKFEDAIAGMPDPATIQDENERLLVQIQTDAMRSLLADLREELLAYERLHLSFESKMTGESGPDTH